MDIEGTCTPGSGKVEPAKAQNQAFRSPAAWTGLDFLTLFENLVVGLQGMLLPESSPAGKELIPLVQGTVGISAESLPQTAPGPSSTPGALPEGTKMEGIKIPISEKLIGENLISADLISENYPDRVGEPVFPENTPAAEGAFPGAGQSRIEGSGEKIVGPEQITPEQTKLEPINTRDKPEKAEQPGQGQTFPEADLVAGSKPGRAQGTGDSWLKVIPGNNSKPAAVPEPPGPASPSPVREIPFTTLAVSEKQFPGSQSGETENKPRPEVISGAVPERASPAQESFLPDPREKVIPGAGQEKELNELSGPYFPRENQVPEIIPGKTVLTQLPDRIREIFDQTGPEKKQRVVELKLEPESLGKVQVTVHWEKGQISARFLTENTQAARALEQGLELLKQNLGQRSIDVAGLQVMVMGQAGSGSGSQSLPFSREGKGKSAPAFDAQAEPGNPGDSLSGDLTVNYLV